MSENRLMQGFSSGETRAFQPDEEGTWRLIEHKLPKGVSYAENLIGKTVQEMPAPVQVNNEQHS